MLAEAAHRGASRAIEDMVCYHFNEACARLGISYNTLQKRIREGKIHPIDGRITGAELRRYLMLDDSPKTRRLMQQKAAAP
ncbi:helix-turn-helix domain-containing protein [Castellaniella sp.]|uniref:helix-turn-helix domain-containing protein n=1 Tax=Castellaniella sp. TaxID=1955812 RepID=UPI002AFFEE1E|nr:helix-turn-helix domain-containing protein [Castellaniella sp.]